MTYRDDTAALYERVIALQREVDELREERAERERAGAPSPTDPRGVGARLDQALDGLAPLVAGMVDAAAGMSMAAPPPARALDDAPPPAPVEPADAQLVAMALRARLRDAIDRASPASIAVLLRLADELEVSPDNDRQAILAALVAVDQWIRAMP